MQKYILPFFKSLSKKLQEVLPDTFAFLKGHFLRFIRWRKARMQRFKALTPRRKLANIAFTLSWMFVVYLIMVDINFLWLFGKSPGLHAIENPEQNLVTTIISSDDKVIGKFFTENRTPVKFEEISPKLIDALIYTEDERFYRHFGIDIQGVIATIKDILTGNPRGGSTITQQLVKNMFKTRNQYSTGILGSVPGLRMLIMKTKEWVTAVKIEIFYTKQEILTMYLNTVDFGSGSYGIYTAARTYFKVHPSELTYLQSATLVGLLKATTFYSPILNPERSLARRNVVLQNLADKKVITQETCDELREIPLQLKYSVEKSSDGEARYFRTQLARFLDEWEAQTGYDIYNDGLTIYVTLDSRMQEYAEEAVAKQMNTLQRRFFEHWRGQNPWQDEQGVEIPEFVENIARKTRHYARLVKQFDGENDSVWHYLNKPRRLKVFDHKLISKDTTFSTMDSIRYMNHFLHTGFIAMEPASGHVKAWVGDINYDFWQYDKVAQSKRQPGSTFKLFVYTAAIENGIAPCDKRTDQPVKWEYIEKGQPKVWEPKNADWTFRGSVTLKHAFARSINTVAVQLAQEVGIPEVIKYAHKLGIKTPLEDMPSTSLGSSDVSLYELVNSFGTIVNEGQHTEPVLVTRIEDRNGKLIYTPAKTTKRAIPYQTAFLVTELLKGGMTEPGGTTQALWEWDLFNYNTDFGGKTGTSSNHSDAWFVGVTKNLVAGAWVGGEHRSVHFRTGRLGEGSKTALPIYGLFMEKVLKDESLKHYRGKFPTKPTQEISLSYKCHTYIPRDTVPEAEEGAVEDVEVVL